LKLSIGRSVVAKPWPPFFFVIIIIQIVAFKIPMISNP